MNFQASRPLSKKKQLSSRHEHTMFHIGMYFFLFDEYGYEYWF